MPNSTISIQVLPLNQDNKSSVRIIDQVIKLIKKSGVKHEVGPLETTMEGDLGSLLEIVKKIQYLVIKKGAESVHSNIKIIYSPKGVMTIEEKVKKHR
ncbi:hypothetical protein A3D78_07635 [Candidatus Gottesmanbacteria bacterium RIFCSPHIGHO2_02_FULL_39_14]|uniref:Thiamine-binding protein domain-containing protein n=1 Tax=Candidatus Gottesmanbacteria bacterium RIFCSPHIGHO2_02_FULL_39_14 TaxID=1798383 RepID=A0A1F5ZWY1_9BACT|nr:MAG: hypothetical protein A3D78_07635 [Candidatus Gottesmanbacteria bacterium RIFCSPHIGHO2_02_FULL_39_14]